MKKKLLKIHELEVNKMYDMVNNPSPNYLLYFIDDEGLFHVYDTVVKVDGIDSRFTYNELLKAEFFEVVSIEYAPNGRRIFYNWIKYSKD